MKLIDTIFAIVILSLLLVSCGGSEKSNEIIDLMPKTIDTFKSFVLVYIGFKFYSFFIDIMLSLWMGIKTPLLIDIVILIIFYVMKDYGFFMLLLIYFADFLLSRLVIMLLGLVGVVFSKK